MTTAEPNQESEIDFETLSNWLSNAEIYASVREKIIITTEDKIEICLKEYLELIGTKNAWITPLSILIVFVVTLITATFKDKICSAAVWQAIFVVAAIISFVWLSISIIRALSSKQTKDVINEMKRGAIKVKPKKDTA